jgi:hypothetical protein
MTNPADESTTGHDQVERRRQAKAVETVQAGCRRSACPDRVADIGHQVAQGAMVTLMQEAAALVSAAKHDVVRVIGRRPPGCPGLTCR